MSSETRHRLVCRCKGVASFRVYDAVRAASCATVLEVAKVVRAGAGCGLCHPEIEEILCDVRGEAVDPALSLENEAVCRHETTALVERALLRAIAPRLAPLGARVGAIAIEGLQVRVRLEGAVSDAATRLLDEMLRTHVCADLVIDVASDPNDEADARPLG